MVCCLLACLQHHNTQPHTACHTVKQIYDLKLEVLLQFHQIGHPAIFTSSVPCKMLLHGQNFGLDEEVGGGA